METIIPASRAYQSHPGNGDSIPPLILNRLCCNDLSILFN